MQPAQPNKQTPHERLTPPATPSPLMSYLNTHRKPLAPLISHHLEARTRDDPPSPQVHKMRRLSTDATADQSTASKTDDLVQARHTTLPPPSFQDYRKLLQEIEEKKGNKPDKITTLDVLIYLFDPKAFESPQTPEGNLRKLTLSEILSFLEGNISLIHEEMSTLARSSECFPLFIAGLSKALGEDPNAEINNKAAQAILSLLTYSPAETISQSFRSRILCICRALFLRDQLNIQPDVLPNILHIVSKVNTGHTNLEDRDIAVIILIYILHNLTKRRSDVHYNYQFFTLFRHLCSNLLYVGIVLPDKMRKMMEDASFLFVSGMYERMMQKKLGYYQFSNQKIEPLENLIHDVVVSLCNLITNSPRPSLLKEQRQLLLNLLSSCPRAEKIAEWIKRINEVLVLTEEQPPLQDLEVLSLIITRIVEGTMRIALNRATNGIQSICIPKQLLLAVQAIQKSKRWISIFKREDTIPDFFLVNSFEEHLYNHSHFPTSCQMAERLSCIATLCSIYYFNKVPGKFNKFNKLIIDSLNQIRAISSQELSLNTGYYILAIGLILKHTQRNFEPQFYDDLQHLLSRVVFPNFREDVDRFSNEYIQFKMTIDGIENILTHQHATEVFRRKTEGLNIAERYVFPPLPEVFCLLGKFKEAGIQVKMETPDCTNSKIFFSEIPFLSCFPEQIYFYSVGLELVKMTLSEEQKVRLAQYVLHHEQFFKLMSVEEKAMLAAGLDKLLKDDVTVQNKIILYARAVVANLNCSLIQFSQRRMSGSRASGIRSTVNAHLALLG